jgi:hypothetical protein
MTDLYTALCETWTGERVFGAPTLQAAVHAVRGLPQK